MPLGHSRAASCKSGHRTSSGTGIAPVPCVGSGGSGRSRDEQDKGKSGSTPEAETIHERDSQLHRAIIRDFGCSKGGGS